MILEVRLTAKIADLHQRFCGVGEVRGFDALENWFWVRRRSNKIGSPIDS